MRIGANIFAFRRISSTRSSFNSSNFFSFCSWFLRDTCKFHHDIPCFPRWIRSCLPNIILFPEYFPQSDLFRVFWSSVKFHLSLGRLVCFPRWILSCFGKLVVLKYCFHFQQFCSFSITFGFSFGVAIPFIMCVRIFLLSVLYKVPDRFFS